MWRKKKSLSFLPPWEFQTPLSLGTPRLPINLLRKWLSQVQLLSHVRLFVTPWTATCQVSLSTTNSRSLLKFMSIASVMPSNHLILCCPLLLPPSIFPSIRVFPMTRFFTSGGQSIGVSASAPVLPMNIQDLFPLGLTGLISLLSKGILKSLLQHHSIENISSSVLSLLYGPTFTAVLEKP